MVLFSKFHFLFSRRKGQMLIEAIVAITVLSVGLLGIVSLLSNSLGLNRVISEQYTATYLAAEGIEVVKNAIDHDTILRAGGSSVAWNQNLSPGAYEVEYGSAAPFAPNQDRFLCFDDQIKLYSYSACGAPGSAQTNFKRRIVIEWLSSDEMRVVSIVNWKTRGGGNFTTNVEDHFTNWRL